MKKLFLGLIALLLVPNLVSAEVKEIGDIVYTTEEFYLTDFMCDELKKDELYLYDIYEENLVFYNNDKDEAYLIDLSKKDNCKALTDEELEKIDNELYNKGYYEYTWEEDNKIYKTNYSYYKFSYGYVLTEEDITDEKTYYQFVDEKWVVAENPTNAQKDVLFERVLFNHVKEAFNENTDYYYMPEIVPDLFKKVENPVKEEYEQYIYYEKEKNIPEKEYMFTLNNTKFVLPKEKSETKEEIVFTRENLYAAYVINEEKYLLFWHDDLIDSILFKEDGTLVSEKVMGDVGTSKNNIMYLLDNEYNVNLKDINNNIIYNTKNSANAYMIANALTLDNTDYFFYIDEKEQEKIIKLAHYYLEEGANLTYENKDLTIKFSGDLNKLSSVKVNDKELSKDNYTTKSGSTIITLNKKYLDTLEKGTYTLGVEYSDGGYSSTTFIIEEKVPNTFDGITSYIILGIISLIGILMSTIIIKKTKKEN